MFRTLLVIALGLVVGAGIASASQLPRPDHAAAEKLIGVWEYATSSGADAPSSISSRDAAQLYLRSDGFVVGLFIDPVAFGTEEVQRWQGQWFVSNGVLYLSFRKDTWERQRYLVERETLKLSPAEHEGKLTNVLRRIPALTLDGNERSEKPGSEKPEGSNLVLYSIYDRDSNLGRTQDVNRGRTQVLKRHRTRLVKIWILAFSLLATKATGSGLAFCPQENPGQRTIVSKPGTR